MQTESEIQNENKQTMQRKGPKQHDDTPAPRQNICLYIENYDNTTEQLGKTGNLFSRQEEIINIKNLQLSSMALKHVIFQNKPFKALKDFCKLWGGLLVILNSILQYFKCYSKRDQEFIFINPLMLRESRQAFS